MQGLFDPIPAAKSDPWTSKAAARDVIASGTQKRQQADTLIAVKQFPWRTSLELAGLTGMDRYTLARRLPELERLGLVRKGPVSNASGRPAVTWGVA